MALGMHYAVLTGESILAKSYGIPSRLLGNHTSLESAGGVVGAERSFSAADGAWRVAFAFDTTPKAILLVPGDKQATNLAAARSGSTNN